MNLNCIPSDTWKPLSSTQIPIYKTQFSTFIISTLHLPCLFTNLCFSTNPPPVLPPAGDETEACCSPGSATWYTGTGTCRATGGVQMYTLYCVQSTVFIVQWHWTLMCTGLYTLHQGEVGWVEYSPWNHGAPSTLGHQQVWSVQCEECSVQVYSVQCEVCSLLAWQCAVCSVQFVSVQCGCLVVWQCAVWQCAVCKCAVCQVHWPVCSVICCLAWPGTLKCGRTQASSCHPGSLGRRGRPGLET